MCVVTYFNAFPTKVIFLAGSSAQYQVPSGGDGLEGSLQTW